MPTTRAPDSASTPSDSGGRPDRLAVVMTPGELFAALDGRVVIDSDRQWPVKVYSVSDRGTRRWIQLSLQGSPRRLFTLRVSPYENTEQVLEAFSSWLTRPLTADPIRAPEE